MHVKELLEKGYAALTKGDAAGAERILGPVMAQPSPPAPALHLLGLIRGAQGRPGEAEALMRRALAANPADVDCRSNLGLLYLRVGAFEAAVECFRETLARNANFAGARLNLVRALDGAERRDEAEAEARRLVQSQPSVRSWSLLGGMLRKQCRIEEALEAFDRALALSPSDVATRHDRAIALNKAGRGDEAISEYEALHAGGLRAPALYRNWAGALLDAGRLDEAEAKLLEGVSHNRTDAALQDNLARMRWIAGDQNTYARDFVAVVRDFPDNQSLRIGCADLLRRGDQREASEALLREGLQADPDSPAFLGALGVVRSELGDLEEAEIVLKRALPSLSHDWAFVENVVTVLLRAGKAEEALSHIMAARAARPLDQAWVAHEASAYCALHDPAFAKLYDYSHMVRAYELPAPAGFADPEEFNAALTERLRKMHQLKAHPIDQSLVNGTQTAKSLLESDDPLILGFLASVDRVLRQYIAEMPDDPDHPFWGRKPVSGRAKLKGCWSVRLRSGGYHVNHVHPEGWISSAYYAVVPAETAGANDHQGWIQFGAPRWPTPGVEAGHFVEPRPGRLVLFPSYMWHGTIPFQTGAERMTIAFDAVPA